MIKIYRDWGHEPSFEIGIVVVVETQLAGSANSAGFANVVSTSNSRPVWYRFDELEVISEHR